MRQLQTIPVPLHTETHCNNRIAIWNCETTIFQIEVSPVSYENMVKF